MNNQVSEENNQEVKSNFGLIPIMAEALGTLSLPTEKHLQYKSQLTEISISAPNEHRRRRDNINDLEHICNTKNQNLFKQYKILDDLKHTLIDYSLHYIKQTGFECNEVLITDAWLNRGGKDAILAPHTHNNSFISGTYYVNFDPDKHSCLRFFNDRMMPQFARSPIISLPSRKDIQTPFNLEEMIVKVPEGTILFWKSHLIHGFTEPNPSDNRLTVSFNVMPKTCSDGDIYSFSVQE